MTVATPEATLDHAAARALYDRIGAWQDTQRFYEDIATTELLAHADLSRARAVVEFGSGTGRLAERLLRQELTATATYVGFDISGTMVELARKRLVPWADRARVEQSDGSPHVPVADGMADRFVSTFVLDLLSTDDIARVVSEAHRVLSADGLLCLVSATHGRTLVERAVMTIATRLHAASPALVGGCRAIDLRSFVTGPEWCVLHRAIVSKWGIPSEVILARPRRI
jgi:SAM-dependent methyltransferase